MVSAGSNLTPADWPIVRTRGDSMVPEEFTLTIDGTALTPTSAIAQVRTARSRRRRWSSSCPSTCRRTS